MTAYSTALPGSMLRELPSGYRQRADTEIVRAGDYMQIGSGYFLMPPPTPGSVAELAEIIGHPVRKPLCGALRIWTHKPA